MAKKTTVSQVTQLIQDLSNRCYKQAMRLIAMADELRDADHNSMTVGDLVDIGRKHGFDVEPTIRRQDLKVKPKKVK